MSHYLFMHIPTIAGNVANPNYRNWIACHHLQLGAHTQSLCDEYDMTIHHVVDITVCKWLDCASPLLLQNTHQGSIYKSITLNLCLQQKDNLFCVTQWTLFDAHISHFQSITDTTLNANHAGNLEHLSISAQKLEFKHTPIQHGKSGAPIIARICSPAYEESSI